MRDGFVCEGSVTEEQMSNDQCRVEKDKTAPSLATVYLIKGISLPKSLAFTLSNRLEKPFSLINAFKVERSRDRQETG